MCFTDINKSILFVKMNLRRLIRDFIDKVDRVDSFIDCLSGRFRLIDDYSIIITSLERVEQELQPKSHSCSYYTLTPITIRLFQFFDFSISVEIIQNMLSSGQELYRESAKECLQYLRQHYNSFLLDSIVSDSFAKHVLLLQYGEIQKNTFRWLNSLVVKAVATSHDSSAGSRTHHVAVPIGQSFRFVYKGAFLCIREFMVSSSRSCEIDQGNKELEMSYQRLLLWLAVQCYVMRSVTDEVEHSTLHFPIAFAVEGTPSTTLHRTAYIISELAPERSLQDAFLLTPTHGQRITLEPLEKVSILWDVARALQLLHSVGIVHGRLKPSNILLFRGTPKYRAKVADIGLELVLTPRERLVGKGADSNRWTG